MVRLCACLLVFSLRLDPNCRCFLQSFCFSLCLSAYLLHWLRVSPQNTAPFPRLSWLPWVPTSKVETLQSHRRHDGFLTLMYKAGRNLGNCTSSSSWLKDHSWGHISEQSVLLMIFDRSLCSSVKQKVTCTKTLEVMRLLTFFVSFFLFLALCRRSGHKP